MLSWLKSNSDVVLAGRKRTLRQTLCYSVCVPVAHTWTPWGPVLVFPGLAAVSALSHTASRPTMLLQSIGVWVILQWLHMTGCQKLDRVKRKAGISHSSCLCPPIPRMHTTIKRGRKYRELPLSLYLRSLLLRFFFFCSKCTSISFSDSSVHILCDRKNDMHGLKWSSCKTAIPSKWIVSLPVINKIYFTTNTQRVSPLHKTRAMTCWCPVWDLVSHIISLTSP